MDMEKQNLRAYTLATEARLRRIAEAAQKGKRQGSLSISYCLVDRVTLTANGIKLQKDPIGNSDQAFVLTVGVYKHSPPFHTLYGRSLDEALENAERYIKKHFKRRKKDKEYRSYHNGLTPPKKRQKGSRARRTR